MADKLMKLEEKLQHAILATLQLKGLTVRTPEPTNFIDLYYDDVEIGLRPDSLDTDIFMYTIYEMLRKGEVELNFRFDKMEKKNNIYKNYDTLIRADIAPEVMK